VIDRIAPTRRPPGAPAGYQKWRTLLFLHWQVPVEALRPLIPKALSIDTFEDKAYVGIVPFTMVDVRPRRLPAVSLVSDFHEMNVRTYVHLNGRDPGVWFFSLDAAKAIPVRIARRFWHLPYFRSDMELAKDGDDVHYRSERRWPEPVPASFEASYRIGESIGNAKPDTFEHFLAERYFLYSDWGAQGLKLGQVNHVPYPLHRATINSWREDLFRPLGLPSAQGEPLALFSPGVDVEVFALKPV
jgi:uncharacterized protein YqjF (DUF2071 family)